MNRWSAVLCTLAALALAAPAPARADPQDLSAFVGQWAGQRETVTIESGGAGHYSYLDVESCPLCTMSDMPYAELDFVLTAASGNAAAGPVTADVHHRTGQTVLATLNAATADAPTTLNLVVDGADLGLFCPVSEATWCGG